MEHPPSAPKKNHIAHSMTSSQFRSTKALPRRVVLPQRDGGFFRPSTDWFKGKFTGKPHISWENQWFPVDFPINQSIEAHIVCKPTKIAGSPSPSCLTQRVQGQVGLPEGKHESSLDTAITLR